MNFKLKTMLAALALTAVTVPAQAAFTTSASGSSSFFLTVLDNTNSISALFDLGYSNSTFSTMVADAVANGGTLTWNLTTGDYASAWSTYLATATTATTSWAVMSGDNTGPYSVAGNRNLITTYSSGTFTGSAGSLATSLTNFDTYLSANSTLGNQVTATDGASTSTSGTSYAGAGVAYGSTGKINASGYDTTSALGETVTLKQISNLAGAANGSGSVSQTTLGSILGNYTMSLSSTGVLTFSVPVAAVPEADTNAMLMVGLGMIGFMARRRKA